MIIIVIKLWRKMKHPDMQEGQFLDEANFDLRNIDKIFECIKKIQDCSNPGILKNL